MASKGQKLKQYSSDKKDIILFARIRWASSMVYPKNNLELDL